MDTSWVHNPLSHNGNSFKTCSMNSMIVTEGNGVDLSETYSLHSIANICYRLYSLFHCKPHSNFDRGIIIYVFIYNIHAYVIIVFYNGKFLKASLSNLSAALGLSTVIKWQSLDNRHLVCAKAMVSRILTAPPVSEDTSVPSIRYMTDAQTSDL